MGVHFGHLVAIHERRGRHEDVCVRDGAGHGHVAAVKAPGDAGHHAALDRHQFVGGQQRILGQEAVLGVQAIL